MKERNTSMPQEVVTETIPGVMRMTIENGGWSFGTPNYYLVRGLNGAVVVDSGTGSDEEYALFEKTWFSQGKPPVAAIIVTHEHFDHDGGSFSFSDLTGAPIIGGLGKREDERTIDLGEREITILPTPGHTEDSLCVYDVKTNTLFTGDTIIEDKSVVVSNMTSYLASLKRLERIAPLQILPGHGDILGDAKGKIAEYIAHTNRRERMIKRFLHHGLTSIDALTKRIYPHKPEIGKRQITSHIQKLIEEGYLTEEQGELTVI